MNTKLFSKLPRLIFLFLIFINPFIYWPFAAVSYELPKVWFVSRTIEALGLVGLLSYGFLKRSKYDYKLLLLVIAFITSALSSSYFGIDFPKSLFGNYYRADGLITLTHFFILFLFLLLYFEKTWLKKLFKAIFFSNFVLNIWAIIRLLRWSGGVGISFGNPNFLAGYLLVTLPFTSFFMQNRKSSFYKLVFFLQIFAIAAALSWAGILGAVFYLAYLALSKYQWRFTAPALSLMALIATALVLTNFVKIYDNGILLPESRTRLITKGLLAFRQRPLLGWGWANFDYAFEAVDWPMKLNNDVYVDKAHSTLLEVLVTTGTIGFIVYLGLLLRIGKALYYSNTIYKKYLFAAFILYLFHTQTNITSISEELIFWSLAAVSAKLFST